MLNIGKLAPGQHRYYLDAVARGREDYYTGSGEAPGYWRGTAAAELGLEGRVGDEELHRVLLGLHPDTGENILAVRARNRVQGWDCTFRAPKGVALLWALGDADTSRVIQAAHDEAVHQAMAYLDRTCATVRRGKGGHESLASSGFVAALFRHRTSRAGDPLLHTHVLTPNMLHGVDGRWTAIDGRRLYGMAKTAGYLYQAHLRYAVNRDLAPQGRAVEWTEVRNGLADVAGIPRKVIRAFSIRRTEIELRMSERGEYSPRAAQTATLSTRKAKDYDVDNMTLGDIWRARADDLGLDATAVDEILHRAPTANAERTVIIEALAEPTGVTEFASTFLRRDAIRGVCDRLAGGAPVREVEAMTDEFLAGDGAVVILAPHADATETIRRADGTIVRTSVERRWSTPEMIATETAALESATARGADGVGTVDPAVAEAVVAARPSLSAEQTTMIRELTGSGRGVDVVVGKAGTGKCVEASTLLVDPVTGHRHTIAEVYTNPSLQSVITLHDQQTIGTATIAAKVDTGVQPCLRVTLSSGRSVITTAEHPFLTTGGWTRADSLVIGDTAALPARLPLPTHPTRLPPEHVDLLAVLLAEGGYTGRGILFSTTSPDILQLATNAARACGARVAPTKATLAGRDCTYAITGVAPERPRPAGLCRCGCGTTLHQSLPGHKYRSGAQQFAVGHGGPRNPVGDLLRDLGCPRARSKDKSIPPAVFQLPGDQLARFLAVFWMCDGYVDKTGPAVTLASEVLVRDLQHLLLRLGIQSSVRPHTSSRKEARFASWRLTVYSRSWASFAQAVPLWGSKAVALRRLLARTRNPNCGAASVTPDLLAACREVVTQHPGLLTRLRDQLGWTAFQFDFLWNHKRTVASRPFAAFLEATDLGDAFGWLLSSDLFWDRITSVERVGSRPVYDLTVLPSHCFIANDVVVHNTFALDGARDAWQRAGYTVVGAALAARAAAELQDGSGIASSTLDRLLSELDRAQGTDRALDATTVVVVDEASMAGTRKLARLLDHARRAGAKVVLVGDHHQLPEIEAGGLFRGLHHRLPSIELTQNRRQRHAWEREVLDHLRVGEAAVAMARYHAEGRVTYADDAPTVRAAMMTDWWSAYGAGEKVLMVALRSAEVDTLNAAAHQLRLDAGQLGAEALSVVRDTEYGAAFTREFRAGDRVMTLCNRYDLGVRNGTYATVVSLDATLGSIDAHERGEAPETVLTIRTDAGADVALPRDYVRRHLAHAYAITGHKAEGATGWRCLVLGGEELYREWGYVAMSRGIEANHLYVLSPEDPWSADLDTPPLREIPDPILVASHALERSQAQGLATEGGATRAHLAAMDTADLRQEQLALRQALRENPCPASVDADLADLRNAIAEAEARIAGAATASAQRAPRAEQRAARAETRQWEVHLERLQAREAELVGQEGAVEAWLATNDAAIARYRSVSEELELRTGRVTRRLALDPPPYVVATVGEAPTLPAQRKAWARAVYTIERYRARWDITDESSPLGPRPTNVVQRDDYRQTWRRIEVNRRHLEVEGRAPTRVRTRRA